MAVRSWRKKLGRTKGSRDKERVLDLFREQIKEYLQLGISLSSIRTILNPQLELPINYPFYRCFVRQNAKLLELWQTKKGKGWISTVYLRTKMGDTHDIAMIVTPAYAHYDIARRAAPFLQAGQIVVLNPGRTLGAIEFKRVLEQEECQNGVTVAETQTFIYASRSDGPAQARIFRIKDAVPLAALPATKTSNVLEILASAYPQLIDGGDVLQTGINNIGAIFHPTISILNAGWIESTNGGFQFYLDGVTPTVAHLMEVLDRERVTVASAVGVQAKTAREWLKMAYNADGDNLHDAIHNHSGYRGINAPPTLTHRYIIEDIPMSLGPIASLGNHYGVSVRGMESIIRLACIAHQTDYWRRGRTLDRLGIKHLSVSELTRYVTGRSTHQLPIHARHPKLAPISVSRVEKARETNGQGQISQVTSPVGVVDLSEKTLK